VGAAIGAPLRYNLDLYLKKRYALLIPYETTLINMVGSFVLGLVISAHGEMPLFFGSGLAGSFTTWSTFAVESHNLFTSKNWSAAAIYGGATFFLCLGSAALGIAISG
jgi:fluoride exporter